MERISSKWTFLHKRIFPALYLGIALAMLVNALWTRSWGPGYGLWWLVFALFNVVAVASFWLALRHLVDEVEDHGDALVVKSGGEEQRIALAEILTVNSSTQSGRRLEIRLAESGRFGDRVVFLPERKVSFNPWKPSEIYESLVRRVDAAKRGAGARGG
ncbi:MAG: hypothetical protein AAGF23_19295 [Acidobacteriota bacterium]